MAMPQAQGPGSTLADVIGAHPTTLSLWNQHKISIDDDPNPNSNPNVVGRQPLSVLLTNLWRYWGKSVKDSDEGAKWRNSQFQAQRECVVLGDATRMDVDSGDPSGSDGSFLLDLPLPGLEVQKIWVRKDYMLIYDELESWMVPKDPLVGENIAPSAVVTGQPGIGKSVWVYYALRRRIGEEKPVIWYHANQCFLFVKEGVFQKPPNFGATEFQRFVWTLVDADDIDNATSEGVPPELVVHMTKLYVIYVGYPDSARWRRLNKTTRFMRFLMEPWSREEMRRLVFVRGDLELALTESIYDEFGPVPRLWIDLQKPDARAQYERDVSASISALTSSALQNLVGTTAVLAMDAVSHKICLLTRIESDQPSSLQIISPITLCIRSMLVNRMRNLKRVELVRLYRSFSKISSSRAMAGIAFEAYGHQLLQEHIALDIVPVVRPEGVPRGKPPWHSSHVFQPNRNFDTAQQVPLRQATLLEIKPNGIVETGASPLSVQSDIYYLPKKTKEVAMDSFILHDGHLYLFQFTMGDTHTAVRAGHVDFLERCKGIPAVQNWRFVFIVPTDETVVCPALPHALDVLPVFSAVISVA